MRLSKIYSNNKKFKTILFSEGLNVILADIEKDQISHLDPEEGQALEHNLGKTALLNLIDYLLLKDSLFVKDYIESFNLEEENWTFFLEIKLNNEEYVTIRRSFNNPSKVSFKKHLNPNQNYINEEIWDYTDIGMSSKVNPKEVLQNIFLNFTICPTENYRQFLNYLMRTQDDYQDIFRLSKFRGPDTSWKPQLFQLLGFNGNLLTEKYEYANKIEDLNKKVKDLEYSPDKDDINKIDALLNAKENERISMKEKIDSFNFFEGDQKINQELTQEIIDQISELNKEEYRVNLSLRQIHKALDDSDGADRVDVKGISNLFDEINIVFPLELKKSLQDVIEFSKQITSERNTYLRSEKEDLERRRTEILEELQKLNSLWSDKLGTIVETDSFTKYDKYRDSISAIDAEIITMKNKKNLYQKYKLLKENTKTYQDEVDRLTKEIDDEIIENKDKNMNFKRISDTFTSIYRNIFEGTAVIFPRQNKEGNIEFEEAVENSTNTVSGKSKGNTSKMTLCASFALALILSYESESFFRFTYLDGAFEGWGNTHKKKFVDMIREYSTKHDIQVIITIIKSDIPDDVKFSEYEIKKRLLKGSELFGIKY